MIFVVRAADAAGASHAASAAIDRGRALWLALGQLPRVLRRAVLGVAALRSFGFACAEPR